MLSRNYLAIQSLRNQPETKMIHKSVSMETTIHGVISKLGLKKVKDLPYDDMIEWTYGALALIGGLSQYEEVEGYELDVVGYKAKLPFNMYEITDCSSKPFKTKKDTIIVGVTDTKITINYLKLPVDEKGYPLVPDDESYAMAIMWRCAQFLSIQGILPNKQLSPEYCKREWLKYCGQARAEAIAPTPDQWERVVNAYRRLVPLNNEFETGFAGLNNREELFRHDPVGSRFN